MNIMDSGFRRHDHKDVANLLPANKAGVNAMDKKK
jgi:hypothetical protein